MLIGEQFILMLLFLSNMGFHFDPELFHVVDAVLFKHMATPCAVRVVF